MYYIGLDVHKKTISYCVKEVSGQIHSEGALQASGTGQLDENTPAALGRSDGSNYFHWLDIRSSATPRG